MPSPPTPTSAQFPQVRELERLRVLVEASKLINSSIEPSVLFSSIVSIARKQLGVERGTLFFVDEAKGEIWARIPAEGDVTEIRLPMGKGIAGTVAATGETVIVPDAWADPRFDPSTDRRSGFRTRSILCVPIHNREGRIVGVLQLLNKIEGGFGEADLEFLELVSDHVAIGMENATNHLSLLEKDRMQRELALGKEIQKRLLPEPPRGIPGVEIAASSVSCFEVGGDSYDFLALPSGGLGLAIADVSGKGVAAALVMSSLQAALRVATPLASTGVPIGLVPAPSWREAEMRLAPGDTLVLYTDGLTEATSPDDEEFGHERFQALAASLASRPPEEVVAGLLEGVTAFEAGAHPSDDKTLVVLRREG